MAKCLGQKKSTTVVANYLLEDIQGAKEVLDVGGKFVNTGGSHTTLGFGGSEQGAQVILPDGTKSPVFYEGNTAQERQAAANWAANYLAEQAKTPLKEDTTTVTTDEETGDVTVAVETAGGATGEKVFEAADTSTQEGLNDAITKMQEEIDALTTKLTDAGVATTTTTKSAATDFRDVDVLSAGSSTLLDPDIKTLDPVKPVGITSVTYQTVVQKEPSEALRLQEEVAREELRRQRVQKAIQKRTLMRRRLEGSAQFGLGRIVRSPEEVQLEIGPMDGRISQATGLRSGRGRGSLISGSRGGIGFYSRYL